MTAMVCAALGVSRATVQRRRAVLAAPAAVRHPRARPARALTIPQHQAVLDLLHAPGFVDQAPAEVYATLLDQGIYHCSIRTMYRILEQHAEVRERRAQLRHPVYQKPELLAEGPNQVWSWDITKLMGPAKWTYFYLYVILDIFSRRVVGWCVADAESAALFKPLLDEAIAKHRVPYGQLTLHADRGAPMKAKATALLLYRIIDLLSIAADNVAHPNFRGSYSMKAVAPALAPEVTYGDLDIADGGDASAAFYRIVADSTLRPEARDALRRSLLRYCERDTLALARVHQWLMQES